MLSLGSLQRALGLLYGLDQRHSVDDFVRPMPRTHPEGARRELVLVAERRSAAGREAEIGLLLDPAVARALRGEEVPGLPRFDAWCLALEGVSHFVLLAFRAANDRPVSQLELELQAEVDKFVLALLERARHRAPSEAHRVSRLLRHALFERQRFLDPPHSARGRRYRLAHRIAARYAASLERRYVRDARVNALVDELRTFYRLGLADKRLMAVAA